MGINSFRGICMDRQQQKSKNNHYYLLSQDYQRFLKQKWFMFQNPILFDPNKFIFLYPNYQHQQQTLLNRWKSTIPDIKNIQYGQYKNDQDVISSRWKYAIRRGVPIEYYKIMISVLFNKNFTNIKNNYDKLKSQINFAEPLPLFGLQQTSIKQGIVVPFLNQKGYTALKQLMYLFKKKKGQFFYNKYIGYITSILLIFFQDCQTYDLISTMMDQSSNMSINRQQSLRWQIVFKQQQMKNLAQNFYKIVSKNSQKIAKIQAHFDKYKIDKNKLFIRIVQKFFIQFLPFPFILRLFIIFLNEGVKIFYRIYYTMIIYSMQDLLSSFTYQKCIISLKKKCLNLNYESIKQLTKNSFNLNLKSIISTKLYQNRLIKQNDQRKYYYLPFIKGQSHILSYLDLQTIWNFIPFQFKSYDLQLCYPLNLKNKEQLKLKDMISSYQSSKYNLFIIKTMTNHVFGCFFISSVQDQSKKWIGNNQTFIFTLYPKVNKYQSTRQNNQYVYFDGNKLMVGFGGQGNAIVIKQNLLQGQTYKCHTFRNQPLNDTAGSFQIDTIQAFIFN